MLFFSRRFGDAADGVDAAGRGPARNGVIGHDALFIGRYGQGHAAPAPRLRAVRQLGEMSCHPRHGTDPRAGRLRLAGARPVSGGRGCNNAASPLCACCDCHHLWCGVAARFAPGCDPTLTPPPPPVCPLCLLCAVQHDAGR